MGSFARGEPLGPAKKKSTLIFLWDPARRSPGGKVCRWRDQSTELSDLSRAWGEKVIDEEAFARGKNTKQHFECEPVASATFNRCLGPLKPNLSARRKDCICTDPLLMSNDPRWSPLWKGLLRNPLTVHGAEADPSGIE